MKIFFICSLINLQIVLPLQMFTGTLYAQSAVQDLTTQAIPSQTPNLKYGDDTPESAIRSFYTAIAMADRATIEHILATPKELEEWIDSLLDITYAFHRFSEAAKTQFGEQGKSLYMPSPALLSLKQLKEIKPKESGDEAEWRTNPRLPTKLFRKDGHWKIDISKSFEKPDHIKQIAEEFRKSAECVDAIAEEMENGRYDTIEKVRAELKRRREIGKTKRN